MTPEAKRGDVRKIPVVKRFFLQSYSSAVCACILLVAIFSIFTDSFLSSFNLFNLSRTIASYGFIAAAQLMVAVIGGMNLAVGAVGGLTTVVVGILMQDMGVSSGLAVAVALCVGILFSIGFLIIDFPLAIGLGLFIGALNMVPYLQIIGFVPTIMLAILKAADTGDNFWIIIASATAVFIVVQIIQDGYLVPRIMGKITGLNPAIILLSLSVWGSLMGMLGMIIALPLTTLMLSYYQRYIINQENIYRTESTEDQPIEGTKEK